MHRAHAVVLAVAVGAVAVGFAAARVFADDGAKPPAAAPTKEDKIRRLFAINGVESLAKQTMDATLEQLDHMPGLPAGFGAKFKEKAKMKDIVDMSVPIYAKHFDEATLDAMIAFYES